MEYIGIAIAIIVVFACLGFLFAITAEDDLIEADRRWTAFSRKQDEATRNLPYGDVPAMPRVDAPSPDHAVKVSAASGAGAGGGVERAGVVALGSSHISGDSR